MELADLVKNIGEKLSEGDVAAIVKQLKETGQTVDCFKMTTGGDLLSELVNRNMIRMSDLQLLDTILYIIGRKELINILRQYKNQQRYGIPEEQAEHGGTITVMMKPVYVEILEDILQDDNQENGLSLYGVTSVNTRTNPNVFFQIVDARIPAKQLQAFVQMVEMMKQQNPEFATKLEDFDNSIYSAIQIIAELGDLSMHAQALRRLHKSSGMSITLWKAIGKVLNGQLPEYYTPNMMQDEIRQACLYSKGRLSRLYPGRIWEDIGRC